MLLQELRLTVLLRLLFAGLLIVGPWPRAQAADLNTNSTQAACTFDDGKQMSVDYSRAPESGKNLPAGKVWAPGGQPIVLFTTAPLIVGAWEIPVGAYSMWVIPEKRAWTLIVNRDVTPGSTYHAQEDLARVPMQVGELEQPQQKASIYFGHSAPKQCNMRIYYGMVGTWVEFQEK
ncbi:MAG: DUF2911 domain-containing protein [Acidobacteria bacterium]|nr:DUF2911 domain-containing protein [Acidobacteriota bacterium]